MLVGNIIAKNRSMQIGGVNTYTYIYINCMERERLGINAKVVY